MGLSEQLLLPSLPQSGLVHADETVQLLLVVHDLRNQINITLFIALHLQPYLDCVELEVGDGLVHTGEGQALPGGGRRLLLCT